MQGILKKELNSGDRHYSYEHTMLGRYRFSDPENTPTNEVAPTVETPEDDVKTIQPVDGDPNSTANENELTKKSVHFGDIHEQLTYYHGSPSKSRRGEPIRIHKWIQDIRNAFSWNSLRLLLMDWLFLAILGIGMAIASMLVDKVIEHLQTFQLFLLGKSGQTGSLYLDFVCTYLSWLGYTELLVVCSAIFVHYTAPQAIGSGIPEMKTVLRGVVLKDFLTPRTLISKLVGLIFSLGSGIPIGKMGPFVHIASNYANLLSNLVANVEGAYGNECRKSEMLAAACATGVASTFSAPVGGVLFSIEVTTMYFSVRNYWRGFFAAACAATVFGLLRVLVLDTEPTLVAFYPTQFPQHAFQPEELPIFALIGLISGFIGALFIIIYRNLVMFLRQNQMAKKIFQKNWILYPITVAFIVATITYPRGFGRFLSGRYKFTKTVLDFFSNCTWSKPLNSPESPHGCGVALLASWTNHEGFGPYNVFLVLFLFTVTFFFLAALCNTLPVPCGMFMPLFVVGAALGRLIGEVVSVIFPDGIPNNLSNQPIFPGIYSVVGAASLTGAITHSVSVAMICCELTGQLIYIIPLMIAVIIANAVCTYLQPSIYDTIIRIKHLPYLPDLPPSNASIHLYTAEQIMVSPVRYLCRQSTYVDIRNVLVEMPKLRAFPVVDDSVSMMLLGSISRRTLLEILNRQVGDEARKSEARRRIRFAIETIDRHFREQQALNTTDRPNVEEEQPQKKTGDGLSKKAEDVPSYRPRGHSFTSMPSNEDEASSFSLLTPLRERLRKTSLPSHSASRKSSRVHPVAPSGELTRTKSDVILNRELVASKHDPRCQQQINVVSSTSETPENPSVADVKFNISEPSYSDGKYTKRKSRFTVEPVKRASQTSLPARARRNAIFSSMATTGSNTDDEGHIQMTISRTNSGASTPTKSSLMEPLSYSHQLSITRGINEYVKHAKKRLKQARRKDSMEKIEYDLFGNERLEWEIIRLNEIVELEEKDIDPAPFQLVRRTSVYKVHSLFSLLDLNRAYVTDRGRLVGVVALRDLRTAIEHCQNGIPLKSTNSVFSSNGDVESGTNISLDGHINSATNPPESTTIPTIPTITESELVDTKQSQFTFDETNLAKDQFNCLSPTRKFSTMNSPFSANIEQDSIAKKDAENDVLTPTIKVVHSSSSMQHPLGLTCIQEESEPVSQRASMKLGIPDISSRAAGTDDVLDVRQPSTIAPQSSTPLLLSMAASALSADGTPLLPSAAPYEPGECPIELREESVAQAIEYLRRKSLGPEELKTLEETPLPDSTL